MNTTQLEKLGTFAELNHDVCAQIYQRFTKGEVIPKLQFNKQSGVLFEDPHFTYLFRYIDEFSLLYQCIGKRLEQHVQGEFFYINNQFDGDADEADEHALKVQTILLILARHFEITGRNMAQLSEVSLGFNEKDLSEISQNEEYKAIAKALRFDSWDKAVGFLVARGFAFATSTNHYFLSSAGSAFCENVLCAYRNR